MSSFFAEGIACRWRGLIFSSPNIGKDPEIKVHAGFDAAIT